MKNIITITLILSTFICKGQEPAWTHCVEEKNYQYANKKGDIKDVHKPIRFCWNDGAFGFTDGMKFEVFTLEAYTQDTSKGHLKENFINGRNDVFERGDIMVNIIHGKTTEIQIYHPEAPVFAYKIKTKAIPDIKVSIK